MLLSGNQELQLPFPAHRGNGVTLGERVDGFFNEFHGGSPLFMPARRPEGQRVGILPALVDAPFVHRFGLLERNGTVYLLVCCLKRPGGMEHLHRFGMFPDLFVNARAVFMANVQPVPVEGGNAAQLRFAIAVKIQQYRIADRLVVELVHDPSSGRGLRGDELENVFHFVNSRGEDILVSANRETDEIAIYTIGQ